MLHYSRKITSSGHKPQKQNGGSKRFKMHCGASVKPQDIEEHWQDCHECQELPLPDEAEEFA